MPLSPHDNTFARSASSSSHSPGANTPTHSDDRDEIDFLGSHGDDDDDSHRGRRNQRDRDVLDDDPIHGDLGRPISFKRRQQPSLLSGPARLFASLTGGSPSPSQRPPSPAASDYNNIPDVDHLNHSAKYGSPSDWYIEGPGRRVGYEDLTAIDWIFEYNKERQRLRQLASGAGIVGYVRQLIDASQVWIILLLTGLSVGAIAAAINIASDWVADLKLGYCSSGPEGGHFYLSKTFCCYGYDQGSKCSGWKSWSEALGVTSTGGEWTVGYVFYLIGSVRISLGFGFRTVTHGLANALQVICALLAALLVQEFAIYAKHSGIPEIKTILGGFFIRRFLSAWTLLTKSLGLVCILLKS